MGILLENKEMVCARWCSHSVNALLPLLYVVSGTADCVYVPLSCSTVSVLHLGGGAHTRGISKDQNDVEGADRTREPTAYNTTCCPVLTRKESSSPGARAFWTTLDDHNVTMP